MINTTSTSPKLIAAAILALFAGAAGPAFGQVYNYDANGDGYVYEDDAYAIINHLNTYGSTCYPSANYNVWVDVNLDLCNKPDDVLLVINFLGRLPWQNPIDRFDVDDDGNVTTADLLALIDAANADHPEKFTVNEADDAPFLDVNGDNLFTEDDIYDLLDYLLG